MPPGRRASKSQQIKSQFAGRGKFPGAAAADQSAAGGLLGFGFVDLEQLESGGSAEIKRVTGDDAEWETVVIEVQFVSGDILVAGVWRGLDELGIALQPGELGDTNQHAAESGLAADDGAEVERGGIPVLLQEDIGGIDPHKVASVPGTVIVALAGIGFLVPGDEAIIEFERQFEVKMGAFAGDPLASVGGAAHDPDGIACMDGLAGVKSIADGGEVGIEREDFPALHMMTKDDVDAVGGQCGLGVDIGHRTVGRGVDRIGRFTPLVALHAADVEALVHLPAFGTDATEGAAGPGSADGADEVLIFSAGFEQGPVRGWQDEMAGGRRRRLGFGDDVGVGYQFEVRLVAASSRQDVEQQQEREEVGWSDARVGHWVWNDRR